MRCPFLRAKRLAGLLLAAVAVLTMSSGCPNVLPPPPTESSGGDDPPPEFVLPEDVSVEVGVDGPGAVEQAAMGAMVTLTATPDLGFEFKRWSGSITSDTNPVTVFATQSTRVTAHFAEYVPDADNDGVRDELDRCPHTPRFEQADDRTGCSCSQADDDHDGVLNCDDLCPQTGSTGAVNGQGCSCYQIDDDEDGVPNCGDSCPDTGTDDGPADEAGCGLSQRDTDDDGVKDDVDECADTPFGSRVNDIGCPPVCGNEIVEFGEDCDPPDAIDCDDACATIPAVCGNGIVQAGEDCEPPGTTGCDAACQVIPVCGDGVIEGNEECDPPNNVTCDASCQLIAGGGCGAGSCFVGNGTPGCDDQACCDAICCFDSHCCTTEWDANCAFMASAVCVSGTCSGGTGSCQSPHPTPGCGDAACCNIVCSVDPFCCTTSWDVDCAWWAEVIAFDTGDCICGSGPG